MKPKVGVWIDKKKAVIVRLAGAHVESTTLRSAVQGHPHYAGGQERGGEKKYEERHAQQLNRFFEDVARQVDGPDGVLVFGPGEAKFGLLKHLKHRLEGAADPLAVESSDGMTDAQIVAKVKEHFDLVL
jgi:stalled ribosome rescue protein Dom34